MWRSRYLHPRFPCCYCCCIRDAVAHKARTRQTNWLNQVLSVSLSGLFGLRFRSHFVTCNAIFLHSGMPAYAHMSVCLCAISAIYPFMSRFCHEFYFADLFPNADLFECLELSAIFFCCYFCCWHCHSGNCIWCECFV